MVKKRLVRDEAEGALEGNCDMRDLISQVDLRWSKSPYH